MAPHQPPSSSGLGHHPLKVAARVRIPLGVPQDAVQSCRDPSIGSLFSLVVTNSATDHGPPDLSRSSRSRRRGHGHSRSHHRRNTTHVLGGTQKLRMPGRPTPPALRDAGIAPTSPQQRGRPCHERREPATSTRSRRAASSVSRPARPTSTNRHRRRPPGSHRSPRKAGSRPSSSRPVSRSTGRRTRPATRGTRRCP